MSDRTILTYTGRRIDILELAPDDICLRDIAHSLAVKTRFNGSAIVPYSIAQHSCLCAVHAKSPLDKRIALLHDAEEAYLFDICAPWKSTEPFHSLDAFGIKIREMIWSKYVPDWTPEVANYKYIDHQMLIAEIRNLVHNWQVLPFANAFLELPIKIEPWSWQESEHEFLNMATLLNITD